MIAPDGFEWDDTKAIINLRKHGLRFELATTVFFDPDHIVVDTIRIEDGEPRQKAVGRIDGALFTVIFVVRHGTCRLISARRANRSEERTYEAV